MGKMLIVLGTLMVLIGVLVSLRGEIPFLGRLPGDIRIEREHFSLFIPLGSGLLISALASLLLWLLRR